MKEHSQVLFLLNDERETAYVMHKIPINQIIYPQFITAQQLNPIFCQEQKNFYDLITIYVICISYQLQ